MEQEPVRKKNHLMSVALIAILGLAVYGNTINGGFIWDDQKLIENNKHIKAWSYVPQVFTADIGAGSEIKARLTAPFK